MIWFLSKLNEHTNGVVKSTDTTINSDVAKSGPMDTVSENENVNQTTVSGTQIESLLGIINKLTNENVDLRNSTSSVVEKGVRQASKSNPQGQMLMTPSYAHGVLPSAKTGAAPKRKAENEVVATNALQAKLGDDCEIGIALASKRQGNLGDANLNRAFASLRADVKAGILDQRIYNTVTRRIKTEGYNLQGEIGHVCASKYFENDRETDTGTGALDSGHDYNMSDQNPDLFGRITRLVSTHNTKSAHSALSNKMPVTFSHS